MLNLHLFARENWHVPRRPAAAANEKSGWTQNNEGESRVINLARADESFWHTRPRTATKLYIHDDRPLKTIRNPILILLTRMPRTT